MATNTTTTAPEPAPAPVPAPVPAPNVASVDDGSEIVADLDDSSDDYDSLYGSSKESATTSLASSITAYKYENGRRYQSYKDATYWQPNDDAQAEHLDLFHHVFSMRLQGNLYLAPIGDNPQRILDVGTGTGIWAIDIADKFPSAQVIGNDLSPTQPSWVPPNLTFEVDDVNLEWTYTEGSFDFVHIRSLFGSIDDWPGLMKQAYRVVRPGGWIESVETTVELISDDGTVTEESVQSEWAQDAVKIGYRIGRRFDIAGHVEPWLKEAGFVDVVQKMYKLPVGTWPKDPTEKMIGTYNLVNMLDAAEGFSLQLWTQVLGWSLEKVHEYLIRVKAAMKKKSNHAYYRMYVAYGRKPE